MWLTPRQSLQKVHPAYVHDTKLTLHFSPSLCSLITHDSYKKKPKILKVQENLVSFFIELLKVVPSQKGSKWKETNYDYLPNQFKKISKWRYLIHSMTLFMGG